MKKWKKISEYLFFQEGPGVRNHQYTSNGVKLLNVANLVNGIVDLSTSERYISFDEAYGKYKHFLADEGDLIIASSGIKVDYFDKKMGFIRKEHLPICMNTSTIRFKSIDKSKLDINYFMYYLKSQSFKDQLSKQITGSAQLNFGPSHLKKMEFPIVDIQEQSLINSVLGNIQSQIRLKEEQLTEYDQLIKSRFVEMFGNIRVNSKNHEQIKLRDISLMTTGGTPSRTRPDYFEGNLPWITTVSLGKVEIDGTDAVEFITEEAVNCSSTKIIPAGSLLFGTRVGVGKISLNKVPMCTNQDIVAITNVSKDYNLIFLKSVIDSYSDYFNEQKRGATIQGIKVETLKNIDIPKVEIELQKDYSMLVQQIDKLKFAVQLSLNETQQLFNSLMQEYFGQDVN